MELSDREDLTELRERHDKLPEDYREGFGESFSAEHLTMMIDKAEKELEADVTLSKGDILPRLAYNLVDPVSLAVTAGTGGVGALAKVGVASSRAVNAAKVGTVAALENVAIESMLQAGQQNKDPESVLYAGLGGMLLGGSLGAILKPAAKDKVADKLNRNLSAAETTGSTRLDTDEIPDAPKKFGVKATLGFNRLFESSSETVKNYANKMFDGLSNKDKSIARDITAESVATLTQNRLSTFLHRSMQKPFSEWAEENGYGVLKRNFGTEAGEKFRTEVTLAMRDNASEVSPQAKEVAKGVADVYAKLGERAKELGLKGFEEFVPNPNYVPRIFNQNKLTNFIVEHSSDAFDDLVEAAIRKGELGDEIKSSYKTLDESDKVFSRLAKGYSKVLRNAKAGGNLKTLQSIDMDDIEYLETYFEEAGEGFGREIAEIFSNLKAARNQDQGRISRAKRRLTLDENTTINWQGKTLSFSDVLENDIGKVTDRYIQVMSGWIGAAEQMGIKSQADWDKVLRDVVAEKANFGDVEGKHVKMLDEAFNLLVGNPIDSDPFSVGAQAGRFMRDVNFPLMMAQSGVAQLAELGNIIANSGFSALAKAVPEVNKLFKRARDGKLEDELAEELEFLFGTGTHTLRNRPMGNFDEYGNGFTNSALTTVDPYVQSAKKFVSVFSGLTPVTDLFQRVSARSFVYKLAKVADSGKLDSSLKARLKDAGLTDEDIPKVLSHLKSKTTRSKGKVKRLNYEKWDSEVLNKFQVAVHRINRRVIQENDIGSSHPFLHKELGKILFQFRGFILNAWVKQTLHGVHFRDRQLGVQALSSMLIASLAYTAQQSINHASDSEKLRDRLKPSQIAGAAFHRAGIFSIAPALADTTYGMMTGGESFSPNARATGLAQSGIASNPTMVTLGRATNTALLPLRLLQDDYNFSQENVKNAQGLVSNFIGLNNAFTPLYKDLPKKSRKQKTDSFFEQVFDE